MVRPLPSATRTYTLVPYTTLFRSQPLGVYHYLRVAGLHGNDQFMVIHVAANTHEFHRRLDHTAGRIPIPAHYPVRKRPVICSDPHGCPMLLADAHKGSEALSYPLQLAFVCRWRFFTTSQTLFI